MFMLFFFQVAYKIMSCKKLFAKVSTELKLARKVGGLSLLDGTEESCWQAYFSLA